MGRKKNNIEEANIVEDKVGEIEKEDNASLELKRNKMINDLRALLLTKRQILEGGRLIRVRFANERQYEANIVEINEIGKKLGHDDITLNNIRRE